MPKNTRLKKIRLWLSTMFCRGKSLLWKRRRPARLVSPRWNIYQSCATLPLDRFVKCLADKEFKALIIDGDPPDEKLAAAWSVIMVEYFDLKGDSILSVDHLRLSRDIARINNHLELVDMCVGFLADEYNANIAASLRRLGYIFSPSDTNPESYIGQLEAVISYSKTKYMQLLTLANELEKVLTDQIEEVGDIAANFEERLLEIEEMQRVSYSMDGITVLKFVSLEKKLVRRIEMIKAKSGGKN